MPTKTSKFSATFQVKELADLFSFNSKDKFLVSISTDSRLINSDQVFLPLVGEKFDGHDFIDEALNKCSLAFCESAKLGKVKKENKIKLIVVDGTLNAYHLLAQHYLKKINPKVIAVTGSSGKTTTKDLISSVASVRYSTCKTEGNFNNEIGVAKTILEMLPDTKVLVLEFAMRARGEISYLAATANPDIAVIINVGVAHIGRLGGIDEIVKAKCEILEHLKISGTAILFNDPRITQCASNIWHKRTKLFDLSQTSNINFKEGKTTFSFQGEEYTINALGTTHVLNSLCAILVGKELNLSYTEIQRGLSNFKIPEGRGDVIRYKDSYIIDESYNANPDSVKAAVSNMIEGWGKDYRKVLVLGELAELGSQEDKLLGELGIWLEGKPLSTVITVGDKLDKIASANNVKNIEDGCTILERLLKDKSVILVKGSHVAHLEKVIEYFKKEKG